MANCDYAAPGAYFVTICTPMRAETFGQIADGQVWLNLAGRIVVESWLVLETRYRHVAIDEWRIMPDHLHGVLILAERMAGAGPSMSRKPLGGIIGAFKTESTNRINQVRGTPGGIVWQRDFWDHVVRDDADLIRVRAYIRRHPPHVLAPDTDPDHRHV